MLAPPIAEKEAQMKIGSSGQVEVAVAEIGRTPTECPEDYDYDIDDKLTAVEIREWREHGFDSRQAFFWSRVLKKTPDRAQTLAADPNYQQAIGDDYMASEGDELDWDALQPWGHG